MITYNPQHTAKLLSEFEGMPDIKQYLEGGAFEYSRGLNHYTPKRGDDSEDCSWLNGAWWLYQKTNQLQGQHSE